MKKSAIQTGPNPTLEPQLQAFVGEWTIDECRQWETIFLRWSQQLGERARFYKERPLPVVENKAVEQFKYTIGLNADCLRHIHWLKNLHFSNDTEDHTVVLWIILMGLYHKEFISNTINNWHAYRKAEGLEDVDQYEMIRRQLAAKSCEMSRGGKRKSSGKGGAK